jgi:hypothetical protein
MVERREWPKYLHFLKHSEWQESASRCQSGGCRIILEAISKFFPNISSDTTPELAQREGTVHIHVNDVHIQLFVTEGMRGTYKLGS